MATACHASDPSISTWTSRVNKSLTYLYKYYKFNISVSLNSFKSVLKVNPMYLQTLILYVVGLLRANQGLSTLNLVVSLAKYLSYEADLL